MAWKTGTYQETDLISDSKFQGKKINIIMSGLMRQSATLQAQMNTAKKII